MVIVGGSWADKMMVNVTVADLRNNRSEAAVTHSKSDKHQLSQLLFGEQVEAFPEGEDKYLRISAIGQQIYNDKKDCFIGCPGFD